MPRGLLHGGAAAQRGKGIVAPHEYLHRFELIADIMFDSAHEARDVAESRAEAASGNQGGGEQSVLLETAAVGVTAPAEQMAPAHASAVNP